MNLLHLYATSGAGSTNTIWFSVLWMVILFGGMYLLLLRPQKKQQNKINAMLADMKEGDSVLTTSGFYGVVIDINDDTVIVEFGNNKNCRIPMQKAAITEVEKASDGTIQDKK